MEQTDNIIINYKYTCDICNYKTAIKTSWHCHILSDKHNRNGQKKPISCEKCDYIGLNHWNLKLHILSQHSTIEERKNSKYYCKTCDQVFFCKLYIDNHNKSNKHKNNLLINQ
jgi:hypothetical protein